jgi:hypothetical protein
MDTFTIIEVLSSSTCKLQVSPLCSHSLHQGNCDPECCNSFQKFYYLCVNSQILICLFSKFKDTHMYSILLLCFFHSVWFPEVFPLSCPQLSDALLISVLDPWHIYPVHCRSPFFFFNPRPCTY